MILKDPDTHLSASKKGRTFLKQSKPYFFIIALFVYSLLLLAVGILIHMSYMPEGSNLLYKGAHFEITDHKYDASLSTPPVISLGISQTDYKELLDKRNQALTTGVLLTSKNDYVPVKLKYQDKTLKAKIRLKGDWSEHLKGRKWSFRVSMKGDDTLLGIKEFALQHPKTRNYIYEWLLHKALAYEGQIALRYRFVELLMNKKSLGIYALEEHFDKRLIEHNHFREGPIIKFDEDLMWAQRAKSGDGQGKQTDFYSSRIDVFQSKSLEAKPHLMVLYQVGYHLLEKFRSGQLKASEVFDIRKMAKMYALGDVFGAQHMFYFHNLRFYVNPITSKLEPIGFDGDAGSRISFLMGVRAFNMENAYYDFDKLLFNDDEFMALYLQELKSMSDPSYLVGFFNTIKKELGEQVNILNKEFSDLEFSNVNLVLNQQFIRNALIPVKGVHAYVSKNNKNEVELRIANTQGLPVSIHDISLNDVLLFSPTRPIVIPGKILSQPLDYQTYHFTAKKPLDLKKEHIKNLKLQVSVVGTSFPSKVELDASPNDGFPLMKKDLLKKASELKTFNFLKVDEKHKIIHIKAGEWEVKKDVVIPKGYLFMASAGVTLDLVSGAKIISYSPLLWKGGEDDSIVVTSSDATGEGLSVIDVSGESTLERVIFEHLSAPDDNFWKLTGAVTFYQADVTMRDVTFHNNVKGDDYLNVIRSKINFSHLHFARSKADAIDIDFSTGEMKNITIIQSGNDAIDFSSSHVVLHDIRIQKAGDKGISVGEVSEIVGEDIYISESAYGIVSKDSSLFKGSRIELINCKTGLSAYQKKSEFSGAYINVSDVLHNGVSHVYDIQEGSYITVDGKGIEEVKKQL